MNEHPDPTPVHEENLAFQIVKTIGDFGINGSHVLCSAKQLANEYRNSKSYRNIDECVDGLINWQSSYAFGAGFVTGLGGILTLPVTIPSGLLAAWVIQARLAGAIAELYGHDLSEDRVRTFVTLCLLGDGAIQALKAVGVNVARQGAKVALERLPGPILIQINKAIGFRLLTKAGEKGAINIVKIIPIIGGVVSGSVDWTSTQAVGKIAKDMFRAATVPTEKEINIFATESTYLGHFGGFGVNSTFQDHLSWAGGQSPENVRLNLIEKYTSQFDRQTQNDQDSAHRFYADASARLAYYRIDLGNAGANGREAGPHYEWAAHQSVETLRGQIAEKVRKLMEGASSGEKHAKDGDAV